jgi:hypothetical protein
LGQLDLDADELGAVGLAVLVDPVGVNEAGGVVLGVVEDGLEQGLLAQGWAPE